MGKTSLYRLIFDQISANKAFFDLENPLDRKVFEEEDFNNVWRKLADFGIDQSKKAYLFLDEVQAMPKAIPVIKYLYDHYQVKFFLTGSSSFYLKNLFSESLAGRKVIFELFPLDFSEFLVFKGSPREEFARFRDKSNGKNEIRFEKAKILFEEFLRFGGFPGVVLTSSEDQKKIQLKDIFQSYFEKEVQTLADFREIDKFRDLMLVLLERAGSKLDISKLSSEIGVSRETVYSYVSFLEGTYFVRTIRPFSRNRDREVSGARKFYVCDTGILNEFSRVSSGSVLENYVFSRLREFEEVKYYQRRSGAEIDFVLPQSGLAFEVKSRASERDILMFSRLARGLGQFDNYVVSKEFSSQAEVILASDL